MTQDEIDLSYRKMMCASIEQAVDFAKGKTLYTISLGRYWRKEATEGRAEAINYILGAEFEYDMMLLGLEGSVAKIRREVENSLVSVDYQATLTDCNINTA